MDSPSNWKDNDTLRKEGWTDLKNKPASRISSHFLNSRTMITSGGRIKKDTAIYIMWKA
jgi:hypothetical protein